MMALVRGSEFPWGYKWRSSELFITTATATALLIDMFLQQFLVSILPYVLEYRLGLDPSLIQDVSTALLAGTALVSLLVTPLIHRFADCLGARTWLVVGLLGQMGGSMIIASAHSCNFLGDCHDPSVATARSHWCFADFNAIVPMLFSGRFLQAVANTIVGVLGPSQLPNVASPNRMEKIYGLLTISMAAGSSGGPLMAGAVFELAGYWTAWTSAFGACLVGILLQSLMLVPPAETDSDNASAKVQTLIQENFNEESPLLVPSKVSSLAQLPERLRDVKRNFHFYACLLTNRRYIGGILSSICYAIVSVSFDTTLPLHVLEVFNWGSLHTGILLGILQGPNAFFSVPVRWLKDRVGSRYPTSVGFLGLAVLLWLAGTPGNDQFPWANLGYRGPIIYVTAVTAIGIFMTLLNGTAMMEAASKRSLSVNKRRGADYFLTDAVREIEIGQPEKFSADAYSQALLISRLSWTFGLFLGPIMSGQLTEKIGYYEMNSVLGGEMQSGHYNTAMFDINLRQTSA
ncbi:hypothetical protein F1880_009986 [Penicillium rolfsii]|nr:hypothetical protein F1880_009986 [Penicillium rolfsii]